MATEMPDIYLEIKADIHQLQTALKTVTEQLKHFDSAANHSGKAAKEMGAKTVAAGALMATVIQSITTHAMHFAKETVGAFKEVGTEVRTMKRILGGTPEEMSHLRFAAEEMGISSQKMTTGLRILSKHLVANDNVAQSLGITYRDQTGHMKGSFEIMSLIADKFKSMPNGMEKTAMAVRAFGRSGTNLIPLLNLGSKGFEEMAAEADKLGLTLSGEDLQAVTDYTMKQRHLHATIQGLQVQFGRNIVPVLTNFTSIIGHLISTTADWIKGNQGLVKVLGYVAIAVGVVVAAYKVHVAWTKAVAAWNARATAETGFLAVAQGIATAATTAWSAVMGVLTGEVAFLEAPIWLIIAAIIALVEIFFYAIRHSRTFAEYLIKYMTFIGKVYGTVIKYIIKGIQLFVDLWMDSVSRFLRILAKMKGPLNALGIHIADGLEGAADAVDRFKTTADDKLNSWANSAPAVGEKFGKALGNGIVAAANFDAMAWIKDKVKGFTTVSDHFNLADVDPNAKVPDAPKDPKDKKKKKPADAVAAYIKEMVAAINKEDSDFQAAKAKMAGMPLEQQQAVFKAFLDNNKKFIAAAKLEEVKTRGTKNHAAAVNALAKANKEQAKIQKELNKITKDAADALNKQTEAQNNLMYSQQASSSWLAGHTATTVNNNTGSIVVPVTIDGREVFRAVQKQSTQNSRRNISNGLTFTGAVL